METLVTSVIQQFRGVMREASQSVLIAAIGGLLLLTSYGAGLTALAFYLMPRLGPVAAWSIIGGVCLVVGLVLIFALTIRNRRIRKRRHQKQMARSLALATLPAMIKASPTGALVAVAATAFVLARMR